MRTSLIAALGVMALASCTTPSTDPGPSQPAAGIPTALKPSAIVGMWYRQTTVKPGQNLTSTMLFSPDGTGISRVTLRGFGADLETANDKNFPLHWKYNGDGSWTVDMASAGGYPNQILYFKIVGQDLLHGGQTWSRVDR